LVNCHDKTPGQALSLEARLHFVERGINHFLERYSELRRKRRGIKPEEIKTGWGKSFLSEWLNGIEK